MFGDSIGIFKLYTATYGWERVWMGDKRKKEKKI